MLIAGLCVLLKLMLQAWSLGLTVQARFDVLGFWLETGYGFRFEACGILVRVISGLRLMLMQDDGCLDTVFCLKLLI